jgi:hypothetical protein
MRLTGCLGEATDPCHRIGSGSGGRHGQAKVHHDRLSNLIHGCRLCHGWTHRRVAEAREIGLLLESGDVPEDIPAALLLHSPLPVFLGNDGSVSEMPPEYPESAA